MVHISFIKYLEVCSAFATRFDPQPFHLNDSLPRSATIPNLRLHDSYRSAGHRPEPNSGEIEGRAEKVRDLVLRAEFVKKA